MSYIDGEPLHYDSAESQDEAAAAHQMELDALYRIGCQYNIATPDMALLCQMAQINFNELNNHSYKLNESTTSCLSRPLSLETQALESQQAFGISTQARHC